MTKLENWGFITNTSPYQPPELGQVCVSGEIYGDPRFEDVCVKECVSWEGIDEKV